MARKTDEATPDGLYNAKEVVETLQRLMTTVTANGATAQTVQAACQCAAEISKVLRLHLEYQRFGLEAQRERRKWAKDDRSEVGPPKA